MSPTLQSANISPFHLLCSASSCTSQSFNTKTATELNPAPPQRTPVCWNSQRSHLLPQATPGSWSTSHPLETFSPPLLT